MKEHNLPNTGRHVVNTNSLISNHSMFHATWYTLSSWSQSLVNPDCLQQQNLKENHQAHLPRLQTSIQICNLGIFLNHTLNQDRVSHENACDNHKLQRTFDLDFCYQRADIRRNQDPSHHAALCTCQDSLDVIWIDRSHMKSPLSTQKNWKGEKTLKQMSRHIIVSLVTDILMLFNGITERLHTCSPPMQCLGKQGRHNREQKISGNESLYSLRRYY